MIFVGQTGVLIKLDVVSDISAATLVSICYRNPAGVTGSFAGYTIGTHYAAFLTTTTSELDMAGEWYFNAFTWLGAWAGPSDPVMIRVNLNPCVSEL